MISSTIIYTINYLKGNDWSVPQPLNVFPSPPYTRTIRPAVGHGIQVNLISIAGNQLWSSNDSRFPKNCVVTNHAQMQELC